MTISFNSLLFALGLSLISTCLTAQQVQANKDQVLQHVYKSGEEGYACYRIPAVVTTNKGTVLAFAEARKNSCGDAGDIDLVVKRSEDGGKNWGPLELVWNDESNTCGNPAPIVDTQSGDIILLASWNRGEDHEPDIIAQSSEDTRRVYVLRSSDEGKHWTKPHEITKDVKKDNWTWYATGPGSGIQLKEGEHAGRMVVACDHIEANTKKYYSHIIYSDDRGYNWKLGGRTPKDQVNECEVVELQEGMLMLNMRNYDRSQSTRQLAYSYDSGLSWTDMQHAPALEEPICQASMQAYSIAKQNYILFANPASDKARENMSIKYSDDAGKTWQVLQEVYPGPSAYSDMTIVESSKIGLLYEAGQNSPYEGIAWKSFPLSGLEEK